MFLRRCVCPLVHLLLFFAITADSVVDYEKLAKGYAPKIYLAKDELFKPSNVGDFLARVKLTWPNGTDHIVQGNFSESDLPGGDDSQFMYLTTKEHLDWKNPQQKYLYGTESAKPIEVYAMVTEKFGGNVTDISYFFFFAYNRGKRVCLGFRSGRNCVGWWRVMGDHVGDWEHVTIRLPQREWITSWHKTVSPEYAWDDVPKEDGRAVFYCAWGSHGFWKDAGDHKYQQLPTGEYLIDRTSRGEPFESWQNLKVTVANPSIVTHAGDHAWHNFRGKWGNPPQGCGFTSAFSGVCELNGGPTGPNWKCPVREDRLC